MTQGFQIGTTGHPPEWHVLLRAETPDDEIISDFHLYPTAEIVCDKVYVGKHVSLDRFYTAPPHCGGARQKELQQRRASGGG